MLKCRNVMNNCNNLLRIDKQDSGNHCIRRDMHHRMGNLNRKIMKEFFVNRNKNYNSLSRHSVSSRIQPLRHSTLSLQPNIQSSKSTSHLSTQICLSSGTLKRQNKIKIRACSTVWFISMFGQDLRTGEQGIR